MKVAEAVLQANRAAQEYVGSKRGIRVEEVKQVGDGNWDITLSWLELDEAEQIRAQSDPIRRIRLLPEPPPLERVYRVFEIRNGSCVRMTRAPDP